MISTKVRKNLHLSDLTTLMISPKNGNAASVSNLQGDKQRDRFQRIVSSIDIVSHKQIIGVWARSSDSK